jgi:hypothetical protein
MGKGTETTADELVRVSLLWPQGFEDQAFNRGELRLEHAAPDLGLDALAAALSIEPQYTGGIRTILATLSDDVAVINYRHEVLDDFLNCPELVAGFEAILSLLVQLSYSSERQRAAQSQLHQAVSRLGELEVYVDCVKRLRALLAQIGPALRSAGLRRLREVLETREADPSFQALAAELPALGVQVRSVRSVTIGVNLDPQLLPVEATLLAVNAQRFKGPSGSLLGRLLGLKPDDEAYEGIAPLHGVPPDPFRNPNMGGPPPRANPLLVPLFKDLNDVLESVAKPVVKALRHYIKHNSYFLITLEPEVAFYLGAVRLIQRVRAASLPLCRPEVVPKEERICHVQDGYNLNLALRMLERHPNADLSTQIVTNDVDFGPDGRIFILTGPNQGGKTTYTQAVGLTQVLCQAGLYVPGSSARISPVDGIYTHFPVEERPGTETGRLGEEAQRLSVIFARATRHSLVLLNESLASTSPGEALYLARDVVRALKLLGARAIFATHLHELAEGLERLNGQAPSDCKVVSVVARTVQDDGSEARRTYQIMPGPPMGLSYARDIAARYGISYEQLERALRDRRVIGD